MIPQSLQPERSPATVANREAWLTDAAVLLRPWFSARGYEIPLRLRIGVGALGLSRRTLGVFYPQADTDGFRHITLSPFIDDSNTVVLVLVHELIHAILPAEELHGAAFRAAAVALGLTPPFAMIQAGEDLKGEVDRIVRRLGRFPHRAPLATGAIFSVR